MIVKNYMLRREDLLVLDVSQRIQDALSLIVADGHLSLPVVEGDHFKGCLSIYYIYKKYYEKDGEERKAFLDSFVGDHYRKDIPTLTVKNIVEDASILFANENIPFVPVVNDQQHLLGIVTQKSIFQSFSKLMGYGRGVRLTIHTPDVKGRISRLAKAIKKGDGNIISLAVNDPESKLGVKEIILRLDGENMEKIKSNIEKEGFKIIEIE
ncbi:CBS domain-containing protein [Geosporobacter subterraneus DSM 17957]|uniref:CBS domain-containing protein n=1 Tax=Geosporobacter subterraneus DSM 17957 TaxID=1121919 RepID=A0A1M6D6X9_9FIRM|nr:CBS domain-containing protein [Geosporobacter subterraneus]SHI68996.1 CBS domain-containing protein [Geosporobacter subterraneus DSM 17957]